MMDFEKLVMETLLVHESVSTEQGSLSSFYSNENDFTTLRSQLETQFGITTWPSTSYFGSIASALQRPSADAFIQGQLYEVFPVIDFISYIAETSNKSYADVIDIQSDVSFDQATMQSIENTFVTHLKKSNPTTKNPLFGYIPLSRGASLNIGALQRKVAKGTIGKLALTNFDKLSIRKAIYGILEARKKIRTSVLKIKNLPSDISYVDKVLFNPQQFAGGINKVPSEFRSLYDNASINVLIDISESAKELYESEYASVLNNSTSPNANKLKIKTSFEDFISNKKQAGSPYYFLFELLEVSTSVNNDGYTIENIKKINSEQAKNLIRKLEAFANFISEGEPPNKMKQFGQMLNTATSILKPFGQYTIGN